MNLIEKLGIEKCRGIVDGAPELAELYVLVISDNASAYYCINNGVVCACVDYGLREISNNYLSFEDMINSWGGIHGVYLDDIVFAYIDDLKQAIEKYDSEHAEMIDYSQAVKVVEK